MTRSIGMLGMAWVSLSMVAFFIQGEGPSLNADAREFLAWAGDRGDSAALAMGLTLVGAVFGIAFFARLGAAARTDESSLGATLMAGGIVAMALMCSSMAIYLGPIHVLDHHDVSAQTLQVAYVTGTYMWLAASAGAGVALAAAALLARSTSVLPRWSMWIAGLVALASTIALMVPASTASILPGTLGLYVWGVAVSIPLLRSAPAGRKV